MFTPTLRVVLTAALVSYVTGSAISLTSSTSSIKPLVSSNLTLTCTLRDTAPTGPAVGRRSVPRSLDVIAGQNLKDENDGDGADTQGDLTSSDDHDQADDQNTVTQTSDNVQFVLSMVVSRDGVDLATLSEHFPVTQLVAGFTASGHLTGGAGERGRLQLTWPHPTQAEAGTYRCDVTSLSGQRHTVVFSQTVKVMEEEVTMNDLVNKLHKIELEKEEIQKNMTEMKDEMQKMQLKNNELKSDNDALNKSLGALQKIARVEPNVFFTAILSTSKTIPTNQVVVYDKVVTNEGSAYNSNTGVFTSPLGGYFQFELHAFSSGSNYMYLGLRHNGNIVITATVAASDDNAASNSVTLRLSKGDVVDVIGTSGNSKLYYASRHYIQNTFSGRLIALV